MLMQVCIRAVARVFKKKAPEVRSEKNEGKIYRPFMYLDESGFIQIRKDYIWVVEIVYKIL